jgi:hypothetical protein
MARPARKSAAKAGGISPAIMAMAVDVLKDPKVQKMIVEHSADVVDAATRWGDTLRKKVGRSFGQKGLERRAANVRTAVTALSTDAPDLAAALRAVTTSLDEVDQQLRISAALPFMKRKRAHMKIDDNLDNLERGLFDTALRGNRSNLET